MTTEFDRYAIERTMRTYSNDLTSAAHAGLGDLTNAISRAQSMLSDMQALSKIADEIEHQVRDAQRRAVEQHPQHDQRRAQ